MGLMPGSGLPAGVELQDNELVFFEVAGDEVLDNAEFIYEHTCFVACTNGLRPAGIPSVESWEFPEFDDEQVLMWGGRGVRASDARDFAARGMRLAQFRLPVAPMAGGMAGVSPMSMTRPESHPAIPDHEGDKP
ncbi:MAG: hypothetical protein AB7L13_16560 [Acidimicrobiia bacterium]